MIIIILVAEIILFLVIFLSVDRDVAIILYSTINLSAAGFLLVYYFVLPLASQEFQTWIKRIRRKN